jgi:hypothetical protein
VHHPRKILEYRHLEDSTKENVVALRCTMSHKRCLPTGVTTLASRSKQKIEPLRPRDLQRTSARYAV